MTPESRRAFLRHLLALDLMIVATGVGYLHPESPAVLFGAFLVAVAVAAWMGGDEVGLAATAYAVITLSLFFSNAVDVGSLTAFAATGAVISGIVRVINTARMLELPPERVPSVRVERPALALTIGLPLLIVVMYTDISDVLMRRAPVPSLLQPLILLLAITVLRARRELRPLSAALHPVVIAFVVYALVVFSTSIWARDARAVDDTLSEVVKAIFICVLAASLAASWSSVRRAFTALIVTATILAATSVVQITTGRFFDVFLGLVAPQSGKIYGELSMPRAAGPPNSDPNFYGRILLIVIPLAIALAMTEKVAWRRVAYGAAATIITAGTLVTYSRGAMLAVAVMALLLLFALRIEPRRIALAGAAGLIVLLFLPQSIKGRFLTIEMLRPNYDTTFNYDTSVEKRKLLGAAALAMFDSNPLSGVGAGNYGRHYPRHANEIGSSWIDYHPPGTAQHPHGLFFEIAAETGLLGLIAFCAVVAAALLTLERSRRVLLAEGKRDLAIVAMCVSVAIVSYLVASLFLHESHMRYPALLFGFAIAVRRLS